jgi:hypothetical protein
MSTRIELTESAGGQNRRNWFIGFHYGHSGNYGDHAVHDPVAAMRHK